MPEWIIRIFENPAEMAGVEELQRLVWPGSETEIVPAHMLLAAIHNGGLVIGAYHDDELIGFVFGFPGFYETPDGPRLKHHSHMLGVHPAWRAGGLGFALKRAQWQVVRRQGLDRITWTYDPLLSINARLNIAKLGAVCNTYRRSEYGEMRDGLNVGLPSDRFQVDWWVFTKRVERRLGRRARPPLRLEQYLGADVQLCAALPNPAGWPRPSGQVPAFAGPLLLVEIPPDFQALKASDLSLAEAWRLFTRIFFEQAFPAGYLVTDFVYEQGRSFYVLTDGESELGW